MPRLVTQAVRVASGKTAAREKRRGDHLGDAFRGVRRAPRVPAKPTPKKRKEAGRGNKRAGRAG